MDNKEAIYYSKELLEILHRQFDDLSPEFWHKVMKPMCGTCLAQRGRDLIENGFSPPEKLSEQIR